MMLTLLFAAVILHNCVCPIIVSSAAVQHLPWNWTETRVAADMIDICHISGPVASLFGGFEARRPFFLSAFEGFLFAEGSLFPRSR